ncbi:MAG TPA: hypothetical protein VM492_11495 [Sumerlaeia bacterium]|nr:hypothetical protein [Sumerlaeia bacterium]
MVCGAETSLNDSPRKPVAPWLRLATAACVLTLAAASAYFLLNCWTFRDLKIDDAFITYRFGERLAHNGTLRWNLAPVPENAAAAQQEAARPVEGYTSFLAVLISAVFGLLGFDPLVGWKILGLVLAATAAGAVLWGAQTLCNARSPSAGRAGVPFLVAALYLSVPAGAVHAMSGMETMLFAALLTALAAVALRIVYSPDGSARRWHYALAVGFLLLGMTRPEGALWALVVGAGVGWALPPEKRRSFLRVLVLGFVLPGSVYFVARWVYFGSFLPTTFYAKAGSASKPGAGRLLTYLPSKHEVYRYLRDSWLPLAGAAAVALGSASWVGTRRAGRVRRVGAAAWGPGRLTLHSRGRLCHTFGSGESSSLGILLSLTVLASVLCIAFFAHFHMLMGYAHRFLYPFGQTFWLTLVAPGLVAIGFLASVAAELQSQPRAAAPHSRSGAREARAARRAAGVLAGVGALLFAAALARTAGSVLRESESYLGLLRGNNRANDMYPRVGRALESVAEAAGTREAGGAREARLTLFHHNMGELMYCAPHWDSIDPVGLLDRHVSRHGFSADYVFSRDPDLFFLPSKRRDAVTVYPGEFIPDVSRILFVDPRMGAYEYLGCLTSPWESASWGGHFFVRRALLEAHAWIAPRLKKELDLRIDLNFADARE